MESTAMFKKVSVPTIHSDLVHLVLPKWCTKRERTKQRPLTQLEKTKHPFHSH